MAYPTPNFQRGPSLLNFVITLVVGVGVFAYIAFSIYSRDALWFWSKFEQIPAQILVRCYGEELSVLSDSAEFAEITRLVNEQLSGDKQWQDITISDQTFEDYQTDPTMVILELYYAPSVDVHTGTSMFMNLDMLLTPLVGRFAKESIFLGARQMNFTGGRVHVESTQAIKDYVGLSGLCRLK